MNIEKCNCKYHLGMGPNLQCPVHGAGTCRVLGIEPYGTALKAEQKRLNKRKNKMLQFINYYIVQWFFIRICKVYEEDFKGWGFLFPVIPMSGWDERPYSKNYRLFKLLKDDEV
jgi:hypothetical protein